MDTRLRDFLNSSIPNVTVMQRPAVQGDSFGIEIECEGKNVNWQGKNEDILKSWMPENDGSLRAHHGPPQEWVFKGPANYATSVQRVHGLFDFFDKQKAEFVTSNRTSVHVHFNMGDKNVYQLVNMFILFTILEDLFDSYCGEDRNGNLFCLSSRHAEEQIRWMENACLNSFMFNQQENQRYCSFNTASLNKFGTVEFRGMRGLDNREDVLAWLSIINDFVIYACYEMKSPVTLVEAISMETPLGFIKKVFNGQNFDRLTKDLDEDTINQSVYEGLRLVQVLCYKVGAQFDKVVLKGRDFWAGLGEVIKEEAPQAPEMPAQRVRVRGAPRGPQFVPAPPQAPIPGIPVVEIAEAAHAFRLRYEDMERQRIAAINAVRRMQEARRLGDDLEF